MKTTAAIAMTLMAVAIAAPSQAIEAPAERAAPGSLQDNGLRLNGFRLNGLRLKGSVSMAWQPPPGPKPSKPIPSPA